MFILKHTHSLVYEFVFSELIRTQQEVTYIWSCIFQVLHFQSSRDCKLRVSSSWVLYSFPGCLCCVFYRRRWSPNLSNLFFRRPCNCIERLLRGWSRVYHSLDVVCL